jgi:hypothetical protein
LRATVAGNVTVCRSGFEAMGMDHDTPPCTTLHHIAPRLAATPAGVNSWQSVIRERGCERKSPLRSLLRRAPSERQAEADVEEQGPPSRFALRRTSRATADNLRGSLA